MEPTVSDRLIGYNLCDRSHQTNIPASEPGSGKSLLGAIFIIDALAPLTLADNRTINISDSPEPLVFEALESF